jgi:spore coat protein I
MSMLTEIMNESAASLQQLAVDVLRGYPIEPGSITVIQSGGIKAVWKVETPSGTLCLKRLKQAYDKAGFSVNAQLHIKKAGGRVPSILPDRQGQPLVEYNGQLFVLYEWLEGKDLDFLNPQDLPNAVQGLAAFHIASRGYLPPESSRTSTKLGKWPEQYVSMRNRMIAWKEVAAQNTGLPAHSAYLKHADSITDLADMALDLLEKSKYEELVSPGSPSIVLCHQDFGRGNALLTASGVAVLDLDGVTFDLPARDLRKIIGKLAESNGRWDLEAIRKVTGLYEQVNRLTSDEMEVLYIDLLFPHWFFGLVKNQYQNAKLLKTAEIERTAELELSKVQLLAKA